MTGITDLPLEVLLEIFGYLPPEELLDSVQNVCTTWRELARHPSLWDDFVYRTHTTMNFEEVIKFIEKCPMVKHLRTYIGVCSREHEPGLEELLSALIRNCSDIRTFRVTSYSYFSVSQLDALFEAFPNIEFFEVNISSENVNQILGRVSKCTKLKKLVVQTRDYSEGWFNLKPIVDGCLYLEYLKVWGPEMPERDYLYILENMKDRLSYLKFSAYQPLTQQVVSVLGSFTKLEHLTLEHNDKWQTLNFLPLASIKTLKCFSFATNAYKISQVNTLFDILFNSPFPLLRKLSIDIIRFCVCDRILLKDICQCYPKLRVLKLSYIPPVGARDSFKHICKLEYLESLGYCHSESLMDSDVEYLIQCTKLKHLKLSGCVGLTDQFLVHLAKCKFLESLDLSGCSISGQFLLSIPAHLKKLKHLEIFDIKAERKYVNILTEMMPSIQIYP